MFCSYQNRYYFYSVIKTNDMSKKITLATLKSFVKKNASALHINLKSKFDGMTDGVEQCKDGFSPATQNEWSLSHPSHTLGYLGVWLVGSSRDYLYAYEDEFYTGIKVSNSCGSFIVAIKK